MKRPYSNLNIAKYRNWFYAAALYNLIWGTIVIFRPNFPFTLWDIPQPTDSVLWQVVGMFVLVYAPAYWWAGCHPETNYHFILIGLLGKLCGPIGFVWAVSQNQLPFAFGWIILFNDLIWWPAFAGYLREVYSLVGLWPMLRGK